MVFSFVFMIRNGGGGASVDPPMILSTLLGSLKKFIQTLDQMMRYQQPPQQTQNICITFVQRRTNVFHVGPINVQML